MSVMCFNLYILQFFTASNTPSLLGEVPEGLFFTVKYSYRLWSKCLRSFVLCQYVFLLSPNFRICGRACDKWFCVFWPSVLLLQTVQNSIVSKPNRWIPSFRDPTLSKIHQYGTTGWIYVVLFWVPTLLELFLLVKNSVRTSKSTNSKLRQVHSLRSIASTYL